MLSAGHNPIGEKLYRQELRVGWVSFQILYFDESLGRRLAPVFAHLECSGNTASATYNVWSQENFALIGKAGEAHAFAFERDHAAPALKCFLMENALENLEERLAIHAALLGRRGDGLIAVGRPGAGKSTLALALVALGFDYAGDDVVALDIGGSVTGLPFAPSIKSGSWPVAEGLEMLPEPPKIHKRLDGEKVRYWPLEKAPINSALAAKWLILLNRMPNARPSVTPVDRLTALQAITEGASTTSRKLSQAQFAALANMVSQVTAAELTYSSAEEAAGLLAKFCDA